MEARRIVIFVGSSNPEGKGSLFAELSEKRGQQTSQLYSDLHLKWWALLGCYIGSTFDQVICDFIPMVTELIWVFWLFKLRLTNEYRLIDLHIYLQTTIGILHFKRGFDAVFTFDIEFDMKNCICAFEKCILKQHLDAGVVMS